MQPMKDAPVEAHLLDEAIQFAATEHAGQLDKCGEPYIVHPLRVMLSLPPEASLEMRIAAVLHDVSEDCHVGINELRNKFGHTVALLVQDLTRRPGEPYQQFIVRCSKDPASRLIKLADLRDNMDLSRVPKESARFWIVKKRIQYALASAFLAGLISEDEYLTAAESG